MIQNAVMFQEAAASAQPATPPGARPWRAGRGGEGFAELLQQKQPSRGEAVDQAAPQGSAAPHPWSPRKENPRGVPSPKEPASAAGGGEDPAEGTAHASHEEAPARELRTGSPGPGDGTGEDGGKKSKPRAGNSGAAPDTTAEGSIPPGIPCLSLAAEARGTAGSVPKVAGAPGVTAGAEPLGALPGETRAAAVDAQVFSRGSEGDSLAAEAGGTAAGTGVAGSAATIQRSATRPAHLGLAADAQGNAGQNAAQKGVAGPLPVAAGYAEIVQQLEIEGSDETARSAVGPVPATSTAPAGRESATLQASATQGEMVPPVSGGALPVAETLQPQRGAGDAAGRSAQGGAPGKKAESDPGASPQGGQNALSSGQHPGNAAVASKGPVTEGAALDKMRAASQWMVTDGVQQQAPTEAATSMKGGAAPDPAGLPQGDAHQGGVPQAGEGKVAHLADGHGSHPAAEGSANARNPANVQVKDPGGEAGLVAGALKRNTGSEGGGSGNFPAGEQKERPEARASSAETTPVQPQGAGLPNPATAALQPPEPKAAPARTALHDSILTQIKDGTLVHDGKGKGEMSIRLNPGELGELKIQVRMEDNRLRVEVQADNKMVKDLLMSNLDSLKESLAGKNFTMEGFDVSTGGGGFNSPLPEQQGNPRQQMPFRSGRSGGYGEQGETERVNYLTAEANNLLDVRF